MNEQAKTLTVLHKVFAVGAGPELARHLDDFSPESIPRGEHMLRTLAVRAITLTNDIDRGEYGTGEGLRLRQYVQSLQRLAPPRQIRLDTAPERQAGAMALKQGALLRLFLDFGVSEKGIALREPIFDNDDPVAVFYFVPRRHLISEDLVRKKLGELRESIEDGSSYAVHPRVVNPATFTRWPTDFSQRPKPAAQRPAA